MSRARLDLLAVVSAAVALTMAVVYVAIIRQQGESPVPWFLAALLLGAGAAGYGARRSAPRRGAALLAAGVLLLAMGMLAILSIGFPILVAALGCLVAAARAGGHRSTGRAPGSSPAR